MEKPKLSLMEEFVLEHFFEIAKGNISPKYREIANELKNKVLDAFEKENDISLINFSFDFSLNEK